LDEYALKRALVVFLDSATPADAQVRDQVMWRLAGRRGQARRSRSRIFLMAVAAAATIATAGTALAATGNFPIQFNLIPLRSDSGPVTAKQPVGGSAPSNPPGKTEPASTTIAAAQASFGHHLLTPGASIGAELQAVYFSPAQPVPAGSKPGQQPAPASVAITYSYAGTTATVWETYDPSSAPLTLDAIDRGGPQSKTSDGLGPIDIETVNGSPYAVVRTTVGGPVERLAWKTADGIVVIVEFSSAVPTNTAFAFATVMS
jgi:hypothetical protein